jgi:hypothetical protein
MRRGFISLSALLVVSWLAACDRGGSGASGGSSSNGRSASAQSSGQATPRAASEMALGLTRQWPGAYRGVCSVQAETAPADARSCPPLIPAGALTVTYSGKSLGRDGPEGGFSADLASRSLDRLEGRRIATNGGHWRYDVAWDPRMRRTVVQMRILRPVNAAESSTCRPMNLVERKMLACRVVAYKRGGGVNGGHIAYVWDDARVTYVISVHGYANEPRARAMMAALTAAADG